MPLHSHVSEWGVHPPYRPTDRARPPPPLLLYKKTVGWHRPTGTSKPRRACWVPSLGVLGLPSGVLGLSLGVLGLSLDVLGLNVGVLRLRLGVPGLNLDVPGQVSKLKTSFFRWFCMQAT